jgi:tripartite ATP-independent transporter DctP family solute receptor
MDRRKIDSRYLLVGVLFLGALLLGLPQPTTAQTVIKLAIAGAIDQPEALAAKELAKMVAERTKGGVRIDVMGSGTAGGEREIAEGLQIGTMHMAVLGGIFQNFDPAMMILEWDLLFKSDDHVKAVMYGPVGDRIKKRLLEKVGVRVHSVLMRTPRILTTNKPVNSLEDLKGMKVRVPEMPARVALWRALGARPTPMAWPEVLTGLTLGTIDGQENPAALIVTNKINEAVKNLALTNHLYGFMMLVSSDKFFSQLPGETREVIQQAALEAGKWNDAYVKKTEADFLDQLSKTMKITRPGMEPWRAAAKDVYKQFSNVEGFTDLYQAIVEEGKKF